MKKALITGITGQDGAYLAGLLLNKGYGDMASNAVLLLLILIESIISTRILM